MHQYVLYFGDDIDEGMSKFEYKSPDFKLTPISEIVKDPRYQAFLSEHGEMSDANAFMYIRHRLKEYGPVLVVDGEMHEHFKTQIKDACIETVVMIDRQGKLCRVDLLTSDPDSNKWDWWVVGGRWKDNLLVKEGAERFPPHQSEKMVEILTLRLNSSVLGEDEREEFNPLADVKHLLTNCARISDVNFEKAYEEWFNFYDGIYHLIRKVLTDDDIKDHQRYETFVGHKEIWQLYNNQSSVLKVREKYKGEPISSWFIFHTDIIDGAMINDRECLREWAWKCILPGAFAYQGKWYSKDEMFLHDSDGNYIISWKNPEQYREGELKWKEFFFDFVKKLDPSTVATVVDIHY